MISIFKIPLHPDLTSSPLTRESVISFATHVASEAMAEVRIVLVIAHDEDESIGDIDIATVEVHRAPDGHWSLQYVSHPLQSWGLTASICACSADFVAYLKRCKVDDRSEMLSPMSAHWCEHEGLGPLALLDLRSCNLAPLVPSDADVAAMSVLTSGPPVA